MTEALNCHGEGVVHVVEKPWDERVKDGGEVSRGRGPRSMEGRIWTLYCDVQTAVQSRLFFSNRFILNLSPGLPKPNGKYLNGQQTSKANGSGESLTTTDDSR
jgi:hypothetical protein